MYASIILLSFELKIFVSGPWCVCIKLYQPYKIKQIDVCCKTLSIPWSWCFKVKWNLIVTVCVLKYISIDYYKKLETNTVRNENIALPQPLPHTFFFLSGTNSFIASLATVIVLCLVSFGRIQRSNMLCKNCYNFSRSFDVYLYIIWETFSCSKPCVWLLFWYWYL